MMMMMMMHRSKLKLQRWPAATSHVPQPTCFWKFLSLAASLATDVNVNIGTDILSSDDFKDDEKGVE